MAKAKITKRSVDQIDVATGKDGSVPLWDTEIKGFGVRAYKSGRKVYVFKYKLDGLQGFETIGDHGAPYTPPDTARERALELSYAVSRGESPGARRRAAKPSLTISELIASLSVRWAGTLLGHRNAQSTEIYASVAKDPAHQAIELVAAKLMRSRDHTGATT